MDNQEEKTNELDLAIIKAKQRPTYKNLTKLIDLAQLWIKEKETTSQEDSNG